MVSKTIAFIDFLASILRRGGGHINSLISLETFRFQDEDDVVYEIWLKVFFAYFQNIDSPEIFILPLFTKKISTVTFSEGGYTLSRSQNDKISDIW